MRFIPYATTPTATLRTPIRRTLRRNRMTDICWHCKHYKVWHDMILGCDYYTDGKKCDCKEYVQDAPDFKMKAWTR